MRRVLTVAYDILLVGVAIACVMVVLAARPDSRMLLPHFPIEIDRLLRLGAPWEYWFVGVALGMVALRFFVQSGNDWAPPPIAPARMTSGIVDLTGLSREQPDVLERLQARFATIATRQEPPAVDLVEDIVLAAALAGASDIHMEPKQTALRVSFRVDGVMRDVATFPKAVESRLINRIRVISRLDIAHVDTPQDGRVEDEIRGRRMNLRVSVFPTHFGPKAVIRLLDSGSHRVPQLDEFGFQPPILEHFRRLLHMPQGIVLFTGPTGSGKTTLMYAGLEEIVHREETRRNILTLEDPIERSLDSVNQTQVDPKRGLSFASGLRTALRQDPDVIMVGEIRDPETAQIALQAGQTGHLILTTLHTNSAASAFGRLVDMGIPPFLLASAITAVISMRLVRKLCPHCRVQKAQPAALLEQVPVTIAPGTKFYDAVGCGECNRTGYVGRMIVAELLLMDEEVASAVLRNGSAGDVTRVAQSRGMATLLEDGMAKVMRGDTSLVELLRVVQ